MGIYWLNASFFIQFQVSLDFFIDVRVSVSNIIETIIWIFSCWRNQRSSTSHFFVPDKKVFYLHTFTWNWRFFMSESVIDITERFIQSPNMPLLHWVLVKHLEKTNKDRVYQTIELVKWLPCFCTYSMG